MTTKTPTSTQIPEFNSREEEAAFWDSHDITDFTAVTSAVRLRLKRPLEAGITLRLDVDTLRDLRETAALKGLGPTTLARMWLLERLRQEHLTG
ncbi:MAG: hypothetical protein IPJ58_02580 [Ardenticatenia bacterium]|nr:hypothetical protein [Ardenticatenia bacterium]